jgi:oxaloacetate decarboxylase alpha subunit
MQAANAGLDAVHTAVAPLANGTSQPSAERTVANLRAAGHTVDIDDGALAEMSGYFRALAEAEGLPVAAPSDYDPAYFRHQVPGGMVTTMSRQLAELNLSHLMPAVYEETARVRAELGYPIMVTPFSQVVGTQAVLNVIGKTRYASVPDEVIRYVQGRFGKPTGPLDPGVEDRILALPRARELAREVPMPGLAELRRKLGARLSDEELVLRAVMPQSQVDGMLAAGPARRDYDPVIQPVLRLLRELAARRDLIEVTIEKTDFRLELKSYRRSADARA